MQNVKVRLNETSNHAHVCWLDSETAYHYGRSFDSNPLTLEADQISTWLTKINADFKESRLPGCLPEWRIEFKDQKDITMFKMKWVDNS